MTISTSVNRVVQTGNGATTVWNYSFLIPDPTEVVVQITDKTTGIVTTLNTTQYSITGIGSSSGGTVTYAPALTTNQTITIQRILPLTQLTSLSNQGAFYPTVVEAALDYLTMVCQQLNDATGRALVVSAQGASTIDAQTNRIINVVNGINAQDAVTLSQLQSQFAANGNVPLPTLGQVGQYLKATATNTFAWAVNQVTSSNITDSTAIGRSLLTAADAPTAAAVLNLNNPLMFRNRLFNAGMEIDQRNEGATLSWTTGNTTTYTVDRWYYYAGAAVNKISSKRTANAAPGTLPFGYYNLLTSLSAYTPLSGEYNIYGQHIEADNIQDWQFGTAAAKTTTLSFWVQSTLTGTFSGSVRNAGFTRSYVFTYSISVANTWTKITVTIPGDTTGVWQTSGNGIGASLSFDCGSGSTFRTTAGAWGAGNFIGATGAVSLMSTNAATLAITGVQWELGSVASPFELRPISLELQLCQRYYEKGYDQGAAPGSASVNPNSWTYATGGTAAPAAGGAMAYFKVTKRVLPSAYVFYSPVTGASGKARDYGNNVDVTPGVFSVTQSVLSWTATMNAGASIHVGLNWTVDTEL